MGCLYSPDFPPGCNAGRSLRISLTVASAIVCSNCGAKALTHTVCTACGTYKGKVVSKKAEGYVEEAKEEVKEVKKAKKSAKKEEAAPEVEVKAEEKAEVVEEASEETPEA